MAARGKRAHGFARPLGRAQVASWLCFGFVVACFYPVLTAVLGGAALWAVGAVHTVLAGAMVALAVRTGGVDVEDRRAYLGKVGEAQLSFCHICKLAVKPQSKHCRTCGKCVEGFDHHCEWLNTCIGKRNYRAFLALLGTASLLLVLDTLVGLGALVLHVQSARQGNANESLLALVAIFMCVSLACLGAVVQLLGFHVVLVRNNQTTYEYIVEQMRRKRVAEERRKKGDKGPPARWICWGGRARMQAAQSAPEQAPRIAPRLREEQDGEEHDEGEECGGPRLGRERPSSERTSEAQVQLV